MLPEDFLALLLGLGPVSVGLAIGRLGDQFLDVNLIEWVMGLIRDLGRGRDP